MNFSGPAYFPPHSAGSSYSPPARMDGKVLRSSCSNFAKPTLRRKCSHFPIDAGTPTTHSSNDFYLNNLFLHLSFSVLYYFHPMFLTINMKRSIAGKIIKNSFDPGRKISKRRLRKRY